MTIIIQYLDEEVKRHWCGAVTYLADKLNVLSLNVSNHQDFHLGQEMESHLIHCIPAIQHNTLGVKVHLFTIACIIHTHFHLLVNRFGLICNSVDEALWF